MAETRREGVTLAAILSIMQPSARVFILHRMGPHELEAVGEGTVQEMEDLRCVEVCGDNMVEHVRLTTEDPETGWPYPDAPVLVIIIGGKEVAA